VGRARARGALAYASIAGVSPVVGLYAAPAALVLYALLGSSRRLIVGPMSATAALSAAAVAGLAGNRPDEFAAFIAAFAALLGVLFFDTLPGLFIGIAVSLLLLIYRASKPYVAELGRVPGGDGQFADRDRHPENTPVPGVVVVRVESGLFFANADAVKAALKADAARPGTKARVVDAGAMSFIDVTAIRMLDELAESLAATGVTVALAQGVG
jgi:sulfate permease, SulP family